MGGFVFIIDPNADFKIANRFLLHLAWQDDLFDTKLFHVVTTKNAYIFDSRDSRSLERSAPGDMTSGNFVNAWAGSSLEDVESFPLDTIRNNEQPHAKIRIFIVLDEQGVSDKTCIVAQYVDIGVRPDEELESYRRGYSFDKLRLKWKSAGLVWANLDISSMGFDEYAKGPPDTDGWWDRNESLCSMSMVDETAREDFLRKLHEEGKG